MKKLVRLFALALIIPFAMSSCSDDDEITVATPSIEGEEMFEDSVLVTFKAEAGSTIYYTIDGSIPTTSSPNFGSAPHSFYLKKSATVNAIAAREGSVSEVATKKFTELEPIEVPSITGNEAFSGSTLITITCIENIPIYYTTDGSEPTAATPTWGYNKVFFTIDKTTTVKAIAIKQGRASKIAEKVFTRNLYDDVTLHFGDSVRINNPELPWKSSDLNVAVVEDGWIKAVLCGTATISENQHSFKVTVSPRYTTYTVPYISWGSNAENTKKFMKKYIGDYKLVGEDSETLLYAGNGKAFGYIYLFENFGLVASGVYVLANYGEELVDFLVERYFYAGATDDGVIVFINKEENTLIALMAIEDDSTNAGYSYIVSYEEYKKNSATRGTGERFKNLAVKNKFGKKIDLKQTQVLMEMIQNR